MRYTQDTNGSSLTEIPLTHEAKKQTVDTCCQCIYSILASDKKRAQTYTHLQAIILK